MWKPFEQYAGVICVPYVCLFCLMLTLQLADRHHFQTSPASHDAAASRA